MTSQMVLGSFFVCKQILGFQYTLQTILGVHVFPHVHGEGVVFQFFYVFIFLMFFADPLCYAAVCVCVCLCVCVCVFVVLFAI